MTRPVLAPHLAGDARLRELGRHRLHELAQAMDAFGRRPGDAEHNHLKRRIEKWFGLPQWVRRAVIEERDFWRGGGP